MLKQTVMLMALILVVGLAGHVRADLIGLYEFEGDFTDTSGSDTVFDGTPTATAPSFITDTPRGSGQAVEFSETGLNCGNVSGEGLDMTLAFWIKETAGTATYCIPINKWEEGETAGLFGYGVLLRGDAENHSMLFRMGSFQSYGGWGSELRTSEYVYALDKWNHLVFTYVDATDTATAYLNGEFDAEMTGIQDRGEAGAANKIEDLLMGSLTSEAFGGMLDEVAIWNNALTPYEVQSVYESGPVPPGAKDPNPEDNEMVKAATNLQLSWTNSDPNDPGDSVYVDVWFGTDPNVWETGTKIVDATTSGGENTEDVRVNASVEGTYYWQVDSYTYGDPTTTSYDTLPGDPNMIEGVLWRFHAVSDLAPTVVIDTVDQMTWSGEPVPLDSTVTDDYLSTLTIEWSVDIPDGIMASFAPGTDVEDPTVTLTQVPYSNARIVNAGFESLVLADGDEGPWGNHAGWEWFSADNGAAIWNPGLPGIGYSAYGGEAPEGQNVIWVNGVGAIAQVLTETLAADTTYTLTVNVGVNSYYSDSSYKVELAAGGSVLAEDDDSIELTADVFETSTIVYTSGGAGDPNIGLPLQIRLWCIGPDGGEANFDNVRLTADPPFPANSGVQTVTMTVTVSDTKHPTPDTASMEIDVYADACAMARLGEGKNYPNDLNTDCDIDVMDLALQTATWLNDTSLDGPVASIDQAVKPLVYNGGFQMYKSGTGYTVTAEFGGGGYTSCLGDNHNLEIIDGYYLYGDGTTGDYGDLPGWIDSSGGNTPNLSNTGMDGSTGLGCFGEWSGGGGSRLTSSAPIGYISDGGAYTLSVMFTENPDTRVLRLLADGVEVTPSSQVNPADSAEWTEISRTYEPNALAAHVGKAITVEVGTDEPALEEGHVYFDNVMLEIEITNPILPSVDAGLNMITWSGEAVQLAPTVVNNDPNEGTLTYAWSANPDTGVVFSPSAIIEAPTVTIIQPPLYTSYLADPGLNDEGGWDAIGEGIGYWNSIFSNYTVEGDMCGDIWGAPAGENGFAQTLATTLEVDTDYELSVWLGTPSGYTAPIGYKVQLLVGGTVLAEEDADANSLPAVGIAIQSTVPFDSTGVDPGLVGQPLEIRLLGVMAAVDNENFGFDDAKLLINGKKMPIPGTTVPDPYTVDLTLAVTLEGEGLNSDSLTIDVYDDACLAGTASDPESGYDPGDLNEDCITNLKDFADLATSWLDEYWSTGPVDRPEEE